MAKMTTERAELIAGTLSKPSKMPCHGYSIPADRCKTGSKLRKVAGSTCAKCYAKKGNYNRSNVQNALERRFESLVNDAWSDAMSTLIEDTQETFFRWHDSGDIQSVEHLEKIVAVCKATPNVKHWIPTREYEIVAQYRAKHGEFPANLVVRISAQMVDQKAPSYGLPTSTVNSSAPSNPLKVLNSIPADSHYCPSRQQGNKCGYCRACWDASVTNVSYPIH